MKINDMVKKVHEMAKSKGWYDRPRPPLEAHMLMVSEIAEATEEARKDRPAVYVKREENFFQSVAEFLPHEKPEGEAVELVDAVIRIADYFGFRGWDLEKILEAKINFNEQRSFRHGGKKY